MSSVKKLVNLDTSYFEKKIEELNQLGIPSLVFKADGYDSIRRELKSVKNSKTINVAMIQNCLKNIEVLQLSSSLKTAMIEGHDDVELNCLHSLFSKQAIENQMKLVHSLFSPDPCLVPARFQLINNEEFFIQIQSKEIAGNVMIGLVTFSFPRRNHLAHEAIAEMERMALAGKVSSHIIHEINNPITVINGKAEKISILVNEAGNHIAPALKIQFMECAAKILKMTDRMDRIIRGMKNLTRSAHGESSSNVKVSELISEVLDLSEVLAKKKNIMIGMSDTLPNLSINVHRLKITQVLVNLINNSIDAIAEKGQRWVNLEVINDNDWAYFKVIDSGPGIPPKVVEHLFENYFTTKGNGLGAGVGLPLSRQIAWDHGGDLYLDQGSQNTCFVLKLPLGSRLISGGDEESWEEI